MPIEREKGREERMLREGEARSNKREREGTQGTEKLDKRKKKKKGREDEVYCQCQKLDRFPFLFPSQYHRKHGCHDLGF